MEHQIAFEEKHTKCTYEIIRLRLVEWLLEIQVS